MEGTHPDAVPAALADVMAAALPANDPDARAALAAAEACLVRALDRIDERAAAIDLLAADALLTDACARADGVGALAAEAVARLGPLAAGEAER